MPTGGHPDWVIEGAEEKHGNSTACGKRRSSDPRYLACVEGWYTALAAELKGLYWKDGGPIVIAQVSNETPGFCLDVPSLIPGEYSQM